MKKKIWLHRILQIEQKFFANVMCAKNQTKLNRRTALTAEQRWTEELRLMDGVRNVDKGYWAIDHFIHRGRSEVTHWMPLPEPPEAGR